MKQKLFTYLGWIVVITWFENIEDFEYKATVKYFHSHGKEVTDWNEIHAATRKEISSIVDSICESNNLLKYSY